MILDTGMSSPGPAPADRADFFSSDPFVLDAARATMAGTSVSTAIRVMRRGTRTGGATALPCSNW
ncbi:MAG: hypothetical protein WDM81_03455 [Rhizomicrobium sp.]